MLTVVYGNDVGKVRAQALRYAQANGEDALLTRIEAETAEPEMLPELLGATSLFGEALTYIIEYPKHNEVFDEALGELLPELARAPHHFIIIEGPLLAAQKKRYSVAQTFEEHTQKAADFFNVFHLAEVVGGRRKREAWTGLMEAKAAGLSAEEIIGTLWWQLKMIRLGALTPNAEAAGVKEYPYSKAKRMVANYSEGELERISTSLLALYHEGHRGTRNIDEALEAWILAL